MICARPSRGPSVSARAREGPGACCWARRPKREALGRHAGRSVAPRSVARSSRWDDGDRLARCERDFVPRARERLPEALSGGGWKQTAEDMREGTEGVGGRRDYWPWLVAMLAAFRACTLLGLRHRRDGQ